MIAESSSPSVTSLPRSLPEVSTVPGEGHVIAGPRKMLGEDEDWLWDVANEMEQEDGLIWVYSPGDDGVMAFTDFGIETLTGLIEIYKADPDLLKRSSDPK